MGCDVFDKATILTIKTGWFLTWNQIGVNDDPISCFCQAIVVGNVIKVLFQEESNLLTTLTNNLTGHSSHHVK